MLNKTQLKNGKVVKKLFKVVGVDYWNFKTTLCICSSVREALDIQFLYQKQLAKNKFNRITFERAV